MNDIPTDRPTVPIPPDNPQRQLVVARPESDPQLPHVGVAGDTYTILVTGSDTAGRYTLIDMHIPPDGGPAPHRHDFEEMFTVLEGEVELTFRGQKVTARAGETVNVPANAPHGFRNVSDQPARLLCVCAPAGQRNSFWLLAHPSVREQSHRRRSTPRQKRLFVQRQPSSRPVTARTSTHEYRPVPTRRRRS